MRIYFKEVTEQGSTLEFTEQDEWIAQAVEGFDERPNDVLYRLGRPQAKAAPRPTQMKLHLRKLDNLVVTSGSLKTSIQLLCSRCATSFLFPIQRKVSGLFCQDPKLAGVPHFDESEGKVVGHHRGVARHEHADPEESAAADLNEANEDLDLIYVAEEWIELEDIVREQIQLEIPFQPLCKPGCKGICSNCGTDLNQGQCACAKLSQSSPFEGLAQLSGKLKKS